MATVTKDGIGAWVVEGEFNQVDVLLSLDDMHGALYHVWSDDEKVGVFSDVDAAIEFAEKVCDTDFFNPDDIERDQFISDVEADADALASAGWGTDEDYGGCDDYY